MRWRPTALGLAVAALAASLFALQHRPAPLHALTQDAYVWQRAWSPGVDAAVTGERGHFRRFVLLAAELAWQDGHARVVTVHPDYAAMRSGSSIGVAVRVGPRRNLDAAATSLLCDTARAAIAAPARAGLTIAELQVDYDCAESRLASYAAAVRAVRDAVSPVPVVVTALPSWLRHESFATLAAAAGGFVIQVHSLHPPPGPDAAMTLCAPAYARRAVAAADRLGIPFRVALPTYGYVAGFTPAGKLLGLSAEGPRPAWPAGTVLRTMRSDPATIAPLVREWTAHPPAHMSGVIWYRQPVAGDRLNWRPATLHTVMAGGSPLAHLRAVVAHPSPGLMDVFLLNDGTADTTMRDVTATWDGPAEVITADGLAGFERVDSASPGVTFHPVAGATLAPGERVPVGWLRLRADEEVRADVTH